MRDYNIREMVRSITDPKIRFAAFMTVRGAIGVIGKPYPLSPINLARMKRQLPLIMKSILVLFAIDILDQIMKNKGAAQPPTRSERREVSKKRREVNRIQSEEKRNVDKHSRMVMKPVLKKVINPR